MTISSNRKKSKNNPSNICGCCGIKIFNKLKGSLYCKECAEIRRKIMVVMHPKINCVMKKFSQYSLKMVFELKKNEM